ncbi:hypothetical protein OROGR_025986 [Orobanche gracilis]
MASLGEPWPKFNGGIHYRDLLRPSDAAGATLIEFYSKKYKSSDPLNGWGSEELVYHRLPWEEPDAPYLLEILYEDDDVIVLNKPSGLQVLPGGLFQQRTVLTQLQRHAGNMTTSGSQEPHPVPVHRLGRGTSGILLCAKTKTAKSLLAAFFADVTPLVGVSGNEEYNKGVVVEQPIGLVKYPGVAKGLYVASPSGKPAKVVVLERNLLSNATLVQSDPLYGMGGQPKCSGHESVDEMFAQDG